MSNFLTVIACRISCRAIFSPPHLSAGTLMSIFSTVITFIFEFIQLHVLLFTIALIETTIFLILLIKCLFRLPMLTRWTDASNFMVLASPCYIGTCIFCIHHLLDELHRIIQSGRFQILKNLLANLLIFDSCCNQYREQIVSSCRIHTETATTQSHW